MLHKKLNEARLANKRALDVGVVIQWDGDPELKPYQSIGSIFVLAIDWMLKLLCHIAARDIREIH